MLWINSQPDKNDAFSVDDGLWFGHGVFETIRVHERPLFWSQHMQRLNDGLMALQIRDSLAADEVLASIQALGIKNCVLKIAVTPDNILFSTRPLPADNSTEYKLLPVDNLRSRNPLLLSTKNLNYLENLLARNQAAANGYDDALYVEKDGTLSETSRANIFFCGYVFYSVNS